MPRIPRLPSKTGMYHVMLRCNERKEIFNDDDDRRRFLDTMLENAVKENACVYAYCLMDNHIHILFGGLNNNLAKLMKRINVSYVYYFNKKYKRIGHLFQDRYKSENIENVSYLLQATRYIHNNPVKANIVKTPMEYPWSSFCNYIKNYSHTPLVIDQVLELFSKSRSTAIEKFIEYSSKHDDFQLADILDMTTDEQRESIEQQAKKDWSAVLASNSLTLDSLKLRENWGQRDKILLDFREKYKLSVRQMENVSGLNRGIVLRIYQKR